MRRIAVLAALSLCAGAAIAQSPAPAACESPAHRQFDFWLGEWEVTGGPALDRIVGHNRIERAAGGCALYEHWRSSSGTDGRSLNVYEPAKQRWTQFWIGSDGVVLRLEGGMEDGRMVLRGSLPRSGGGEQLQRITWTAAADGSVEQRWEISDDAGAGWQVSFVGIYRRAGSD